MHNIFRNLYVYLLCEFSGSSIVANARRTAMIVAEGNIVDEGFQTRRATGVHNQTDVIEAMVSHEKMKKKNDRRRPYA